MTTHRWIMSEGGPLIAVERKLQASWGGICRLTVPVSGASNDYERPPVALDYIQTIDLQHGKALIFGEGPVDTTFWGNSDRHFFIVRTIYCDLDFNIDIMMRSLDISLFANPVEQMDFLFQSCNLVVFDSAEDGSRTDVDFIEIKISPGLYEISTILYDLDTSCSIIHRFNRNNTVSE